MYASRLCTLSLALLFASLPISAQVTGDNSLQVYRGAGPARKMSLVPPSAKVLFPGSIVFVDKRDVGVSLPVVDGGLLRNMQFVTVRAYSPEQPPKANSTDQEEDPQVSSARITAVVYGDKIYVVSELFCDENIAVVNALLRSMGASVDSPEKALQVAKFYLQIGYYSFKDPDTFIVSAFGDLPAKQLEFPGQDAAEMQRAIHPPSAIRDGNAYKVELVTQDRDAAFVVLHHWSIRILKSQITDAREEVLIPDRMHYRAGEAASNLGTLASAISTLRFQLSTIADGKTPDSKDLNFHGCSFNTSNGPGVTRSEYDFESNERSIRELDSALHSASQILERGKWTDAKGNVLGERALVLYSAEGSDEPVASILLRHDKTFFEVSSSCLRNLLEFEKVWFHSDSR